MKISWQQRNVLIETEEGGQIIAVSMESLFCDEYLNWAYWWFHQYVFPQFILFTACYTICQSNEHGRYVSSCHALFCITHLVNKVWGKSEKKQGVCWFRGKLSSLSWWIRSVLVKISKYISLNNCPLKPKNNK